MLVVKKVVNNSQLKSELLKKKPHQLSQEDFQSLFRTSLSYHTECFIFRYQYKSDGKTGFGFALSKKKIKLATQRHLCKRLFRESFRHHHPVNTGLTVIVLAKSQASKANKATLWQSINAFWNNATKHCLSSS